MCYTRYMQNPNVEVITIDVSEMKKLTDDVKRQVFLAMQQYPSTEIARKFGFEKRQGSLKKGMGLVYAIYNKVKEQPAKYGLTDEVVEATIKSVENRKQNFGQLNVKQELDIREVENFARNEMGIVRDKIIKIISMKVDKALKSKRAREQVSLKDLSQVLATVIDKQRLLTGQSTENVLHFAKINKDVSPEDALAIVLKARDAIIEHKK